VQTSRRLVAGAARTRCPEMADTIRPHLHHDPTDYPI
jgi:hypothetical protein